MDADAEILLELGQRIREARNALGLTQRDLGAALGVTSQQVQKYETGHSRMTIDTLLHTAGALKVSPVTLIEGLGPARAARALADDLTPTEHELIRSLRTIPARDVHRAITSLTQVLSTAFEGTRAKARKQRS